MPIGCSTPGVITVIGPSYAGQTVSHPRSLVQLVSGAGDLLGSFAFEILIAYSCREIGAVLVTRNVKDMDRIRHVFAFSYVEPYPEALQPS